MVPPSGAKRRKRFLPSAEGIFPLALLFLLLLCPSQGSPRGGGSSAGPPVVLGKGGWLARGGAGGRRWLVLGRELKFSDKCEVVS